jgi:hypothetical protein
LDLDLDAAYRALFQLVRNPFHWEKTPHGLSRTLREWLPARRAVP